MLGTSSTGLHLSRHSLMLVMTNGSTVSAASTVAVAADVHGQTCTRLDNGAILGQIIDGVGAEDTLTGLAGSGQ